MSIGFIALIIVSTELLLTFLFRMITPIEFRGLQYIDLISVLKGLLERAFITVSLVSGYPHALILFGTIKLATRLKRIDTDDHDSEKRFNDFYLIGNFVSIMAAMFYAYLFNL
jgi:hypothetical protein